MDLIKYKTSPRQSCALSPLSELAAAVYTQVELPPLIPPWKGGKLENLVHAMCNLP
jgi:hypothetical protein